MVHSVLIGLLILLAVCITAWLLIRRCLIREDKFAVKAHQILIALITLLIMLIAMIIIFSSDPGNTDDVLLGP